MSLHKEESHEIRTLDAAVESNRRAEPLLLPLEELLLAEDVTATSVVKLTPREPWIDGLAALYCFNASRWDTPANLIYCFPNQAPPGSWNGTVVYVEFTAPQTDGYRVVVRYHGAGAQVRLRGPWGIVSETMPSGQDSDLIEASWTGSGELFFTITFAGQWLGSVSAVQIYRIN